MNYYPLILGAGFYLLFCGLSFARAESVASDGIEIIVEGRSYESVHAYRLKRIKDILQQALFSENLAEFSEKELSSIITEIHKQQVAGTLSDIEPDTHQKESDEFQQGQQAVEDDALDLSVEQMQEMLENYYKKHKDTPPLLLSPEKIKSVIIERKTQSERISEDQ